MTSFTRLKQRNFLLIFHVFFVCLFLCYYYYYYYYYDDDDDGDDDDDDDHNNNNNNNNNNNKRRLHSIAASQSYLRLKKGDDYATTISWIRAKVPLPFYDQSLAVSQRSQEKERSS